MNQSKTKLPVVAALLLCLAAGAGFVAGQGSGVRAQETTAVSGTVAPLLQYQGRLTDPETGEILPDGLYTMTFRLYTSPSGGSALWTETKDVPVKGGLFSTALGDTTKLNQGLFSGQALWLGVKVGADAEAVPRQEVLPVAYALGLLPGAAVQASNSKPALTLSNAGSGEALAAQGPVSVDGDLSVEGVLVGGAHNHPDYVDRPSFNAAVAGLVDNYSFDSHVYDPSAHHARYTDAEAVEAVRGKPDVVGVLGIYYSEWTVAEDVAPAEPFSNGVRATATCSDGDIAINGFVSSNAFLIDTYNSTPNEWRPEEWSVILYNVGVVTTDVYVGAVCADMTP